MLYIMTITNSGHNLNTQFNSIQQLQDVMENNAKKLTINIDINEIAEARVAEIK